MKRSALLLSLLFASGLAAADANECVPPVFPEYSSSNASVRSIAKQVKNWRSCQIRTLTADNRMEEDRRDAQVNAGLEKWMAATLANSNVQLTSRRNMHRLEIEQRRYAFERNRLRAR